MCADVGTTAGVRAHHDQGHIRCKHVEHHITDAVAVSVEHYCVCLLVRRLLQARPARRQQRVLQPARRGGAADTFPGRRTLSGGRLPPAFRRLRRTISFDLSNFLKKTMID